MQRQLLPSRRPRLCRSTWCCSGSSTAPFAMVRIVNGKVVSESDGAGAPHGSGGFNSAPQSSSWQSSSASGTGNSPIQVIGVLLLLFMLFGGSSLGHLLRYPLMGVVMYMALTAANTPRGGSAGRGSGSGAGHAGRGWNVRGVGDLPKPAAGG